MARNLVRHLSDVQAMDLCLAVLEEKKIDMAHFHLHWRKAQEKHDAATAGQ